jgi:hypothetical protein
MEYQLPTISPAEPGSDLPRTTSGRLLAALAQRIQDDFVYWRTALNADKVAAGDLRPTLFEAFREVVERRFATSDDLREIARFLETPRVPLWPEAELPILKAEALIRSALGERGLIAGISGTEIASIRMQLFVHLCEDLRLTSSEIIEIVALAEQYVSEDKAQ